VNPACTPQGVGLADAPNEITNVFRYVWPSRKKSRLPAPMPGECSAVPTEDRIGRNHVKTSPPIGPESAQHNPQQSLAAVEAQAMRRVVLENRQLVTKGEDLRLQGGTGSKTGGHQRERATKRELIVVATVISRMIATICVFRWDGFSVTTVADAR
jgi:hypothetical protein